MIDFYLRIGAIILKMGSTSVTIYYPVLMDTEEQTHFMMKTMSGRSNSVLHDIGETYDVEIRPCYKNHIFYITGNRDKVVKAHECLARAFSRRQKWVVSKIAGPHLYV